MNNTIYEDYKYCIQDVSSVYIGSKYTFGEMLETESIPFKFQLIVERYLLPEADLEDTLETHLYYLKAESFLVKIYRQLKARVKVNVIESKRSLSGKVKKEYVTRVWPVEQLAGLSADRKEEMGLVVQELIVSKLAMMGF
ncbi:MAG: hypothetical protein NC079_02605 [Clostridium sp.]|nr:hypothetical protein [Acetatifactor muris]MCM1527195.1 hypothetical protein [Bacteroides sp.]MCM1562480.1 hypothetical protein [Clostridium sp.]